MSECVIGLVGNPNCGKSTLFNALTGARQKVGNWPGVTVECKSGHFSFQRKQIKIVDLPGTYQLALSNSQAIDERITCEFTVMNQADVIVNIVDACHLERHLYLTLQLLSLQVPIIVAVNMMDVAQRRKIELDLDKLEQRLGCPVIGIVANKRIGLADLKKEIIKAHYEQHKKKIKTTNFPECLQKATAQLAIEIKKTHPEFTSCAQWLAQQLLQSDDNAININKNIRELASTLKACLENELEEELDIIFADSIYTLANQIVNQVIIRKSSGKTLTERLDKIILNRFLGIPIFFGIMYCMFVFAINLGGAFQDFFDIGSEVIFVQGMTHVLSSLHAPSLVCSLLASGFGRGINTTITFIPVIASMFFFLAFLESSGYMARASFVIDRFMRTVGLPGKSFVPMIVGFGCNVPAILAARTLENPRDRALTILMSPFMSCGARLAIFAVFTAAFFPIGGQNVVFALYFIGIVAAIMTGFVLRKTLLKGEMTPLVLELPAYHLPSLSVLLRQTWHRLKSFIFRAGKVIVPICMLIGVLNAVTVKGTLTHKESSTSILSAIGQTVTPLFSPMGIKQENWPATVGLVTGILAKEVVVATLNTLYTQDTHLSTEDNPNSSIMIGLKSALLSIPANLVELKHSFANPLLASAPDHSLNHQIYGIMYERFAGQAAAFAYLLFVLLYFPCISAVGAMAKELNKKWTVFSVIWSTGIAYSVATIFYQLATFAAHPLHSIIWVAIIVLIILLTLFRMQRLNVNDQTRQLVYVDRFKTIY